MLQRRAFLQVAGAAFATALGRPAFSAAELLRYGASPQQLATPISYFDRLITPTPVFFVRSHFGPPSYDRSRTVTVHGLVKKKVELSVDDLRHLPEVTQTAALQCAGNGRGLITPRVPGIQWDHGGMGQATWTGVRLKDVIALAGAKSEARHVWLKGADRPPKPTVPEYQRSIPIERALHPETLIAYRMNGEPLTHAHGGPLRVVVPGWAGDHWVKWLTSVQLEAEEASGFYMQTAYKIPIKQAIPGTPVPPEGMRSVTTFPVKSVIGRPLDGAQIAAGPQEVVGVALSGDAAIEFVEVSTDNGATWHRATLEGAGGIGLWQVFRYRFVQKQRGEATAIARARDKKGNMQPENAIWNPSGYFWNAWHRVQWQVV